MSFMRTSGDHYIGQMSELKWLVNNRNRRAVKPAPSLSLAAAGEGESSCVPYSAKLLSCGRRAVSPGISRKSRRFLVHSVSLCSRAVAAMSASAVRVPMTRRLPPGDQLVSLKE